MSGRPAHLLLLTVLLGCAPSASADRDVEEEQKAPFLLQRAGDMPAEPAEQFERMKRLIRQDAEISYGDLCGTIEIPDKAFIPVEVTGGGPTEVALSLARAKCAAGASLFSGSGGDLLQIWSGSGGPVRLLFEEPAMGFTPLPDGGLTVLQHGAFCGRSGPEACVSTYRWRGVGNRLELSERHSPGPSDTGPQMEYGPNDLAGTAPPQG